MNSEHEERSGRSSDRLRGDGVVLVLLTVVHERAIGALRTIAREAVSDLLRQVGAQPIP